MKTLSNFQISPPEKWQDFESLCRDLWRAIWNDPNTKKNGRSGQAQHGVDIYGRPNLGADWAGVQCKKKNIYAGKTVTEKELLAEVENAKKFKPPLKQWILATTGEKDAAIEEKAREITSEHLEQGLFSVNVWFWTDILEELDSYKNVAEKHYPLFHPGNEQLEVIKQNTDEILLNQQIASAKLSIDAPSEQGSSVVSSIEFKETVLTTEYQAEIDYARNLIQKNRFTEAIDSLKHLKDRIWSNASTIVRFRLLSNLGSAFYKLERFNEAANNFIEALQYNPDDENALSNIALAYLLLKDNGQAEKYARLTLVKNPANINAYCILLNTPPYRNSLLEALGLTPEYLRNNPGIAHNLGWIAFGEHNYEQTLFWFETAFENDNENSPEIAAALGQLLLPNQWSEPSLLNQNKSDKEYKAQIQKSLDLLSKAWEGVVNTDLEKLRANWILNRGVAKRLLYDYDGAIVDIETSLKIEPERPEFIKHRALLALLKHDYSKAVSLLKSILEAEETPEVATILGDVLWFQGEQSEAINVLQNFLNKNPHPKLKVDAAQMLVGLFIELNQIDNAQQIVSENFNESDNSIIALICKARVINACGDSMKALALLNEAKDLIKSETPYREIVELGNEFGYFNQFKDAADCFRIGVDITQNTEQTRILLMHCFNAGNLTEALNICCKLREKFGILPVISNIEISIYEEINDLEKARKLCREYLQYFPNDWGVKQRLAWNSYRLLDFKEVDDFLEKKIDITNLSLNNAAKIAHLYAVRSQLPESIKLLYEMRRKYFNEPEAHLSYVTTFFNYEKEDQSWLHTDVVSVDTAVCLVESGQQKEWFVIEERKDSNLIQKELSVAHPLAKNMLGKKVGEKVVISSGQTNERIGTIAEIKSKYIHALHETMDRYEKMFPEAGGLWQIHMGNPDNPEEFAQNSHKIFDEISRYQERVNSVFELYKNNPLPIGPFAELLGRSSYDAWVGLLNYSEIGAVCSSGHPDELKAAITLLEDKPKLTTDITSLYLLFELNLGNEITEHFGKLLIAPTTIDLIQNALIESNRSKRSGYATIAKKGDQFIHSDITPEAIQKNIEYLEKFLIWIQQYCIISPYLSNIDIPRGEKTQRRETLKPEFYDTICIVKDEKYVFFSEDGRLRQLANNESGAGGTWLQAVLIFLNEKKIISNEFYAEVILRLALLNINFVSINADVITAAAKQANWFPRFPFTKIIKRLGNSGCDINLSVIVVTEFFHNLWHRVILPNNKKLIVFAILETLSINHSQAEVFLRLRQSLRHRFWRSPEKFNYFISLINLWEKVRLIVPYKFR